MKPVTAIVRRADGLRILKCQFLTVKNPYGGKAGGKKMVKECIVESRMRRLRPHDVTHPLTKDESQLLEVWAELGRATLSCRTYRLLFVLCANTTAAPTRCIRQVPRLTEDATDIRPWLCDPMAIAGLFDQLRRFDQDKKYGHQLCHPDDRGVVYDPWFYARSDERIALGQADIAPIVWERAASFTEGVGYNELKEIEQVYLDCLEQKGAAELAEMILGHNKGESGANWIKVFQRIPQEIRIKEVEHWVREYSTVTQCPRDLVYLIQAACRVDPENHRGLCYLWDGLAVSADVQQLLDGLMLWERYGWSSAPRAYAGDSVDTTTLIRLTNLLVTPDCRSWVSRTVWETMHEHPALIESFRALLDEPYGHRGWLLRLLREVQYGSRDDALAGEFNRDFQEVSRTLLGISEDYREKAIEYFEYVYWDQSVRMPAGKLMKHIATLCTAPFTVSHEAQSLWCKLLSGWDGYELPLSSWKRIDSASRSNNQLNSIESGLDRLDEMPARSVIAAGLKFRVRLTLEIIRLASRSPVYLVEQVVGKLQEHPLLDISFRKEADLETYAYLMGSNKELIKWQQHVSGGQVLRAESADQLFDRLEGIRIETLLLYLKDELAPRDEKSSGGLQLHTRLYASSADENRRAYRKLIQRYTTAGENGILFHPRNQQWLREHRYLKKAIWLTGVHTEIQMADGTYVYLELERRFEQILKMGTLVGSCLALDGCNSHAALANAADINKQVVMAYDQNQKFLGRQLVGITEQRQLVCFDVYGQNTSWLEPAFAAFDLELESIMALPLYRKGDYQLKPLVCREWYDDCAWNTPAETDAKVVNMQWGGSKMMA